MSRLACLFVLGLAFAPGCGGELEKRVDRLEQQQMQDRERAAETAETVRTVRENAHLLEQRVLGLQAQTERLEAALAAVASAPDASAAIAEPIRVSVTTTPAGADVFVDGKSVGVTPVVIDGTSKQRISLALRKSGYRAVVRTVELTTDMQLAFELKRL